MHKYSHLLILLIFLKFSVDAQDTIQIDFGQIIKQDIPEGASSANLCWLMDSDLKRPNPHQSFEDAVGELKVGSLRFPYGHLADNYLWHTPPYEEVENGLRPRVAAMSQAPGEWEWAVDKQGGFKAAMDFDEFMALCQNLDIKPLVVVNVFSFKYEGGPTLSELVEAAAEWVKYAKQKDYQVAYWQIGNEVDHHPTLMTREEYVEVYEKVVTAMKGVDPSIKVGPGILSNVSFFNKIMEQCPELIDFTSCHQYMWSYIESCKSYDLWKNSADLFIPNVQKMQRTVQNSVKPEMEILITETGVSPSNKGMGSLNNTWKALWWFEVLMNELSQPNVTYAYFWGTHSPWDGPVDNDNDDVGVLLRVDDNSRKPIAEVVKLVNEYLPEKMVNTSWVSEYIRAYAGIKLSEEKCSILLLNKNDQPGKVTLNLTDLPFQSGAFNQTVLKGKMPGAQSVEIAEAEKIVLTGNEVEMLLPPLSIVVLSN